MKLQLFLEKAWPQELCGWLCPLCAGLYWKGRCSGIRVPSMELDWASSSLESSAISFHFCPLPSN